MTAKAKKPTRPSKATQAEGAFKKLYGASKASMLAGRMPKEKAKELLARMKAAGKI